MEFYFDNDSGTELPVGLTDMLNKVLRLGLTRAGKNEYKIEVGITFVTPEEIRNLNNEYRSVNAVTDVLSFENRIEWDNISKKVPVIPGDIVICIERAKTQAEEYGHSFEREMAFLTAHGLLHLLGYDHENETDEQKMIAEQDAVLNALGIVR